MNISKLPGMSHIVVKQSTLGHPFRVCGSISTSYIYQARKARFGQFIMVDCMVGMYQNISGTDY